MPDNYRRVLFSTLALLAFPTMALGGSGYNTLDPTTPCHADVRPQLFCAHQEELIVEADVVAVDIEHGTVYWLKPVKVIKGDPTVSVIPVRTSIHRRLRFSNPITGMETWSSGGGMGDIWFDVGDRGLFFLQQTPERLGWPLAGTYQGTGMHSTFQRRRGPTGIDVALGHEGNLVKRAVCDQGVSFVDGDANGLGSLTSAAQLAQALPWDELVDSAKACVAAPPIGKQCPPGQATRERSLESAGTDPLNQPFHGPTTPEEIAEAKARFATSRPERIRSRAQACHRRIRHDSFCAHQEERILEADVVSVSADGPHSARVTIAPVNWIKGPSAVERLTLTLPTSGLRAPLELKPGERILAFLKPAPPRTTPDDTWMLATRTSGLYRRHQATTSGKQVAYAQHPQGLVATAGCDQEVTTAHDRIQERYVPYPWERAEYVQAAMSWQDLVDATHACAQVPPLGRACSDAEYQIDVDEAAAQAMGARH